jgi:hypothetical protein
MWIKGLLQAQADAEHYGLSSPRAVPMMEYAIFIAMVIVTIGFAWLWFIEQKKKRKRKEARRKNEIERR